MPTISHLEKLILMKMHQIKEIELTDDVEPSLKKIKNNVAELTRPERGFKEQSRIKNCKPQGRKKVLPIRPAKYHNWLTPFCWTQIAQVAKVVGWKMSPSEIVKLLKKKDPITFANINRTTVDKWIDRRGCKPCWSESVLRRVESGNNPGHDKAGCRGVLVGTV